MLTPVEKEVLRRCRKNGVYDAHLSAFLSEGYDIAEAVINDRSVLAKYQGFRKAILRRRISNVKVFVRGTHVYLAKVQE
jgi:hypothetical protein